jgi:hypothetical protein
MPESRLAFFVMYRIPMSSKNRLSTFRMMSLSSCGVNVARNAALPPASSIFCGREDCAELTSVASSCTGTFGSKAMIAVMLLCKRKKKDSRIDWGSLQQNDFISRAAPGDSKRAVHYRHALSKCRVLPEYCGPVVYRLNHDMREKHSSCGDLLTGKPCAATVRLGIKILERTSAYWLLSNTAIDRTHTIPEKWTYS